MRKQGRKRGNDHHQHGGDSGAGAAARLEQAEEQIEKCRAWGLKLPKLVDETYRGPANRLNLFLEGDLAKAVALLEKQLASLEAYAGLRKDFAPASSSNL